MRTLSKKNYAANDVVGFADLNNISENSNAVLYEATAGEALTAAKGAFIATGEIVKEFLTQLANNGAGIAVYGSNEQVGQTFRTPKAPATSIALLSLKAYLVKTGSPTGNVQVDIYAVTAGHLPTGASLGSATVATSGVSTGYITFTFSSPISLSANTEYAIVISTPSGDSSNYVKWYYKDDGPNDSIPDGWRVEKSSGTWVLRVYSNCDCRINYQYIFGVAGNAYLSDSGDKNRNQFDGIVQATVAAAASVLLQDNSIAIGLSGLTPGKRYFIEDTKTLLVDSDNGSSGSDDNLYGVNWLAQTFQAPAGLRYIKRIGIKLKRNGTSVPIDDITISLRATSAGAPTGADISGSVVTRTVVGKLGTSATFIYFDLAAPLAVTPGTTYALIVAAPSATLSNKVLQSFAAGMLAGGDMYTSGNSGSSWTISTGNDLYMKIYGNSDVGLVTTQPTYDLCAGLAVAADKLNIEDKKEHLIYSETIAESNAPGSSSSCEASYDVPKRTRRILLNIIDATNGAANSNIGGQILLIKGVATSSVIQSRVGSGLDLVRLSASWVGDTLTVNAYRVSGTAQFSGYIYYIGL